MHTQTEMPWLGAVRAQQHLPMALIEQATFNGLLSEAARFSGKDDQSLAAEIHVSQGYMSRCMRGVFDQWARRFIKFLRSTNSLAPLQKIAHEVGCDLVVRSHVEAKLAEARALVAQYERQGRAVA